MTDRDRRATRPGAWLAGGASAGAALLLGAVDPLLGVVGSLGVLAVVVGLRRSSPVLLGTAMGWFALAVLVSTGDAPPPTLTALTVVLCVGCWDAGTRAIRLGRDLTRAAETARLELTQAATTGAVGVGSLAVARGGLLVATGFDSVAPVVAAGLAAAGCVLVLARL